MKTQSFPPEWAALQCLQGTTLAVFAFRSLMKMNKFWGIVTTDLLALHCNDLWTRRELVGASKTIPCKRITSNWKVESLLSSQRLHQNSGSVFASKRKVLIFSLSLFLSWKLEIQRRKYLWKMNKKRWKIDYSISRASLSLFLLKSKCWPYLATPNSGICLFSG